MGYRSEVKSLIYGNNEKVAKFISNNNGLIEALKEDFIDDIHIIEKPMQTFIFLSLEYAKWYEGYSDASRWNELLNLSDNAGLMYEFVRVGEEINDIEYQHSQTECECILQVVTTIEANL
jgi:hypothetical protein